MLVGFFHSFYEKGKVAKSFLQLPKLVLRITGYVVLLLEFFGSLVGLLDSHLVLLARLPGFSEKAAHALSYSHGTDPGLLLSRLGRGVGNCYGMHCVSEKR